MIVGEFDEIKLELRVVRVVFFKISIDLYKEGFIFIFFDIVELLLKRMKVDQLDGSVVLIFYKVKVEMSDVIKKRFVDVCFVVGEVFGNIKLDIKEIILVFYVKIMVMFLEDVDIDLVRVILFCKNYLEKLNFLLKIFNEFY